jgi:hypothetical protein
MDSSEVIQPRVRTVVYVVVLAVGIVLTLGWDLLAGWTGSDALGRTASAVVLVVGALTVAYRPTRPEPGVFRAGEAGRVTFDEGDADAARAALAELAELERGADGNGVVRD